jgi:hypothetical protein
VRERRRTARGSWISRQAAIARAIVDTVAMALEAPQGGSAVPDLDRWLRAPARRASHRRVSRAAADELWRAAMVVRLRECRLLGRLVRARLGATDPGLTFDALFRAAPFVLLDEGPTWSLSGVCGRIWSPRAELARVRDAQAFADWDEPGTARALFAHWAEPLAGGGAAICSEVRVDAVDRRAALRLRTIEPLIVAFQSLIGVEPLSIAVRRADGGP